MENTPNLSAWEASRLAAQVQERTRWGLRSFAWLGMWAAVFMSAYLAVWVTAVAVHPASAVSPTFVIVPLLLIYSGLIVGARERFAIRPQARPIDVVAVVLALLAAFVVAFVGLFGSGIPPWTGLAVGAIALVVLGARSFYTLVTTPLLQPERRVKAPLTRTVQLVTVVVGVMLGALVVVTLVPLLSAAMMVVVSVAVLLSLIAPSSPLGFRQVGLQWGAPQWAGYGVSSALSFAYASCLAFGADVSLVWAIIVGVIVAAATAVTALASTSP